MDRTQFRRVIASAVGAFLLGMAGFGTPVRADSPPTAADSTIGAQLGTERFGLTRLDLPAEAGESLVASITFEGSTYSMILERHSLRLPDFRVLVPAADGTLQETAAPAPRTYRGVLAERPDARVAATLDEGGLTALIVFEDDLWAVQPSSEFQEGADPAVHVVYRQEDVPPIEGTCGIDQLEPLDDLEPAGAGGDGGGGFDTRGAECDRVAEIAFDADFEFFQRNGSSVEQTVTDIERVLNGMNAIYERDVDITHELTTVIVRDSEPDPYSSTSAGTLLDQFRSEWREHQTGVQRDVAHLMTGKNLSGSTIGVAWLGVVCSRNRGYGLSQSRFSSLLASRVGLTSHEVGHNWNASHCDGDSDCKIMCSGLGGCAGSVRSFGARSVGSIISFRNGRSCLTLAGLTILTQPTPLQEVCAGETVSLTVTVEAAFPTYQWRVGSTALVDDGVHIFGATSPTLLLVNVTGAHDASNYNCRVSDTLTGCTLTTDQAVVSVDTSAPTITQQPLDQILSAGDPVVFSVSVEDPFLATYQWRKDGVPLSDDARFTGTATASMFIIPTELGDAGDYDCVVTATIGSGCVVISDTATLSFESGGDCPADLDGDGDVDLSDLSALLAGFGTASGADPQDGDLDGDGDVDLSDLSALLAVFQTDCP